MFATGKQLNTHIIFTKFLRQPFIILTISASVLSVNIWFCSVQFFCTSMLPKRPAANNKESEETRQRVDESQLISISSLHSTVVTLFKTKSSRFRRHEAFQNGEKSLDKKQSKAKDQRRRRSMNFIRTKGKISPKVTRARGSINPRKAKRMVPHLWMCQD